MVNVYGAIIAATSLYTNSTLITRNIKDFSKIKKLNISPFKINLSPVPERSMSALRI